MLSVGGGLRFLRVFYCSSPDYHSFHSLVLRNVVSLVKCKPVATCLSFLIKCLWSNLHPFIVLSTAVHCLKTWVIFVASHFLHAAISVGVSRQSHTHFSKILFICLVWGHSMWQKLAVYKSGWQNQRHHLMRQSRSQRLCVVQALNFNNVCHAETWSENENAW